MLGCVVYAIQMIALGSTTELAVLMAAAFVAGAGIEVFGVGWDLAMQEQVPPDMLSRVYSYDMLGSYVAIPAGQLAFGPLGGSFGLQRMILLAGIGYAVVSMLTLLSGSVRRMTRAPARSTTSAPAS
jgi:MFS family permease